MPISPARKAAFAILRRVESGGAYSSELLHASPLMSGIDERDRGLASEIVLGCLRWRGALDALIAQASNKKLEALDAEVVTALRMGCYQLRYLDRVPPHAALSESVELVKQAGKRSAAGFVNAVLRKLPARAPAAAAAEQAHPPWLVERWRRRFGDQTTEGILQANVTPPATYLRLNRRFPAEETLRRLAEDGIDTEPTELSWCRRLRQGRPEASGSYREGRIRIQDLGSQMVVPLLELKPEHRFLDLCAAPGNKTSQALEERGSSAGAVAADLHPRRLAILRRLATMPAPLVALDAETALPFRSQFDSILVDAPCSGTGTLARNPEIKWRLRPEDLPELARKQARILEQALEALAPGGVLVYSTCSLEPEENSAVVEQVLAARTKYKAEAYLERVPGRDPGDGFYACRIVRNSTVRGGKSAPKQMIE
jgi:16S rRNA (cytosine967-C5)-methyltransferase